MRDLSKRRWISEDIFYNAVLREVRRGKGANIYQVGNFEVLFASFYTYAKCFHNPCCCFRFTKIWTEDDVRGYLEEFDDD